MKMFLVFINRIIDIENCYIHNGLLPIKRRKSCNLQQDDGPWWNYAMWNKSDRQRQVPCDLTYKWHLEVKRKEAYIYKEEIGQLGKMCEMTQNIQASSYKISQSTVRYHFTSVRMAAIQKFTSNKCWRGCGEREPSYTVGGNAN